MRTLYFHPVVSSIFLSSFFPRLMSAVGDWMSTIFHTWCANLECRYETCCLAENTGCKKVAIWATSSGYIFATKAHINNWIKLFKQQYLLHMSPQYGELQPTSGWDVSLVWGTPGNFNGFRVFAVLLHGTLVVGVSQTLHGWTEGATYIRQGSHHVGHWPTFIVINTLHFINHTGI